MLQRGKAITSRQHSERGVEKFKYVLSKVSWQEVYLTSDVNSALQIFRDNFDYFSNTEFPYKLQKFRNNNWITRVLKNSGKRMRFWNSLKRIFNLPSEAQAYIKRYQITYRMVLKEAKKRENDRLIKKRQIRLKIYGN